MEVIDGKAVFSNKDEEAAFKTLLDAEVTGLKAKNAEILGKLKEFDPLKGIDPAEYRTLKEQAAKAEEEKLLLRGDFESVRKQDHERFAKELTAAQEREAKLLSVVKEKSLTTAAVSALAAEKGAEALLLHHVLRQSKLDDNYQPIVVDDSGNARFGKDGKPMTIRDLVLEMKADVTTYGRAFDPSGQSGSGSQQSNGTGGTTIKTMTRTEWDSKDHASRAEFAKSGGKVVDT